MSNMSFVPDEYRKKKMQFRVNTINLVLFIVVMAGVIGAYFVTDQNRSAVTQELRQVNLKFRDAAELLKDLEQLEGKKVVMIRKAQIITQLVEKIPRSVLLAELINNMPDTIGLNEIELKTQKQKRKSSAAKTAIERARQIQEKNKAKSKKSKSKKSKSKKDKNALPPLPKLPPQETLVIVIGVASSDADVAQFMTSLGVSDMFEEVNLIFSEETTVDDAKLRKFRFEMKINDAFDVNKHNPRLLVDNKLKHLMDAKKGTSQLVTDQPENKQAADEDKED